MWALPKMIVPEFLKVLTTGWRRKPAGIDSERNYVTGTLCIHRLKVTSFRFISMPAGFRRHPVGKTLRNVCYSDIA